ncbi:MAG: sulfate/thiosulfate ABC transporter permease CysW, partial [Hypericibacter sp.]
MNAAKPPASARRRRDPTTEPGWVRWLLVLIVVGYLLAMLVLPTASVFIGALAKGIDAYLSAISDKDALAAVRLTLLVAAIAVPLNVVFGLCAAWAIAKFEFRGKSLLITFIDLPFSVSPVISGLIYVLLYSVHGWFGPTLEALGIKVVFTATGIVLATIFVTFPFVARELIPLMQ